MTLAAVDRLVHHATIFEMNVESYRRRVPLERKRGPGRPPTRATPKPSLIDAPRQSTARPRLCRIASPEMLSDIELLPHLKCSRAGAGRDSGDEACEHGNAGRTVGGDGWPISGELATGTGPDPRRIRRHGGISPEARDAASADGSHERPTSRASRRIYDDRVRAALVVLWEASDRICGKRLKALLPILVPTMERHGHLDLEAEVRTSLLGMSAATIDRALQDVRRGARA